MKLGVLALVGCMGLAILLLFLRLLRIQQEMHRMTKQFDEFLFGKTRKRLDIAVNNRELEHLAEKVNQSISEQEQRRIQDARREKKFREDIANISHDLRTPLTAIRGYLSLAEQEPKEDVRAGYYEIVRKKAAQLHQLVDAFFEIAVVEDSLGSEPFTPVDLNQLLQEEVLSAYAKFRERNITPQMRLPNVPVYILGDRLALARIVQNLISNALCYSTEKINVTLDMANGKAVLSVQNTCQAMPLPEQQQLFQRFYRRDSDKTNAHAGLGLYIVKVLTEKQGGTISSAYHDGFLIITLAFQIAP